MAIWLNNISRYPSQNHDTRPLNSQVNLLVIHNISLPPGQFGSRDICDFFTNQLDSELHPFFNEIKDMRVSSHFLIQRNGEIIQFVPIDMRAWHAGISSFEGRERCNDFSIGIELEGSDYQPFDIRQYQALANLTRQIQQHYPAITDQRITGHSDVAPDRKTDPGPNFFWDFFYTCLSEVQ